MIRRRVALRNSPVESASIGFGVGVGGISAPVYWYIQAGNANNVLNKVRGSDPVGLSQIWLAYVHEIVST